MPTTAYVIQDRGPNHVLVKWPSILTSASIGDWFACPHFTDKTVTIDGTFDGATVNMEGVMDTTQDPFQLTDPHGNAISTASSRVEAILENMYFYRPKVTGGTAPDIDVWLLVERQQP